MNTKTPGQPTDQQLVDSILSGDMHAFKKLIKETENLVAQLVFKMIPVAADRKDIAQDVYLKVHKSLPGFRFQSKLSTWIGQITYHTIAEISGITHLPEGSVKSYLFRARQQLKQILLKMQKREEI